MDAKLDKLLKMVGFFKWAMENKIPALILVVAVFALLYWLVGGIIWFFIELVIHMVLVLALLVFLKKKGFFES